MENHHYYSQNNDSLESKPQKFNFNFHDHSFTFITDSGVFSKNYIDFGSFTMLQTFKPNTLSPDVLDVGCGYGPIGIVVSKLYDLNVLMLDINERAVRLANQNAELNQAGNAKAQKSNIYDSLDDNQKFSSIITNPPIRAGKKVVYEIYDGAIKHLLPGGELWVVIQKKQGAPSSREHLMQLFGNCEIVNKNKGYFILKSTLLSVD